MKTHKLFVILCIIYGYGSQNLMPQLPVKKGYPDLNGNKPVAIVSLDSIDYRGDFTDLYRLPGLSSTRSGIPEKPVVYFFTHNQNYYYLLTKPVLFNVALAKPVDRTEAMEGFAIVGTLNGKWEILTGKPLINPTQANYSRSERTDEQSFTESRLYRVAGFVIPSMLQISYPGAPKTVNYPPGYQQPRYRSTEKAK